MGIACNAYADAVATAYLGNNDTEDASKVVRDAVRNVHGAEGGGRGHREEGDSGPTDVRAHVSEAHMSVEEEAVLHLFLQHDKHCVAIARVAAAADGLGHRCLRPKPGGPPASSADAPPAASVPDAAMGGAPSSRESLRRLQWCTCVSASARQSRAQSCAQCCARSFVVKFFFIQRIF